MKLPVSYYDTNLLGDIISKMSYDIDTINTSLSSDIISICTSIITVSGSFMMMLTISPILVLIFVFTIPVSLLFSRFMLKRTKDLFRARSRSLGELNGFVEEMITGTKTIKAYSKEDKILEVFDEYNNSAVDKAYKAEYYGFITGPGVNFINNLSFCFLHFISLTTFNAMKMINITITLFNIYSIILKLLLITYIKGNIVPMIMTIIFNIFLFILPPLYIYFNFFFIPSNTTYIPYTSLLQ
jgi:ATP-binding cassette subfamily B protein